MPELPEVEVLVRHLAPRLEGRTIRSVAVPRRRAIEPWTPRKFGAYVRGTRIMAVTRRGKYLRFDLGRGAGPSECVLLGHLGMTGRMYLRPVGGALAPHVSVVFDLGEVEWVFEDARQFGGFFGNDRPLRHLGPEPLSEGFAAEDLSACLGASRQPIKPRLMDQSVVAGLGNIYASEALHDAGIAPDRETRSVDREERVRLWGAIREVLSEAVRLGEAASLDFAGDGIRDGLFYYGRASAAAEAPEERFRVYDRAGRPCYRCGRPIERFVQTGRSTFCCRACQR
ncbi:MAG: bifunctional DNA-formamidopyrimidine glycosylase/DNA-(apurinic or apyrimidinic site) lyase [Verrucomicrobiales bacterium]|nr:bifunctional DNA-formamidopyrimidine glycosylase/DNA-(apurinic or apyrimidinic site) lyase [Verrucomicrobiales bacterium]